MLQRAKCFAGVCVVVGGLAFAALARLDGGSSAKITAFPPKKVGDESITINYKVGSTTITLTGNTGSLAKDLPAATKAGKIADGINAAAGANSPIHASASGSEVTVTCSGGEIKSANITNNTSERAKVEVPGSPAGVAIGTVELNGSVAGVRIGGTEESTLTINAGGTQHVFALGSQPSLRALANQIIDAFEADGVSTSVIGTTLLFTLPSDVGTYVDADADDRSLMYSPGVVWL